MPKGIYNFSKAINEPISSYAPGTTRRKELKEELQSMRSKEENIRMVIGGAFIESGTTVEMHPPHDLEHLLGVYHQGNASHVSQAIEAAQRAKAKWADMAWEHRASIFLKAAELIAGPYRAKINAATMLAQSKNVFQAEIDAACEFIDFLRFNVEFMKEIYQQQPFSPTGMWNRVEYRPLEGFIYALTPFNFTSIAGNLPAAPALMGNTVVWKPSNTQVYSAAVIMEVFQEAGLPDGVINLVFVPGPDAANIVLSNPDFGGIHFTGSTEVFRNIWKVVGENISSYKSYPRIVGETGGKDFIVAHPSANTAVVATAMARGAFEYQGQKCSAASRAYVPKSIWEDVSKKLQMMVGSFKMGPAEDFSNFINAVISQGSYKKITDYIKQAKSDADAQIFIGGNFSDEKGYFIEPTVILTENPQYTTMKEEIFGPVLTVYLYDDKKFDETLTLVDSTSSYALTGAIIAHDRYAIERATKFLSNSAGNFYINDKPTGAVVGQQPFGGARASGTNDKAGSALNLLRWVSPRTIKETFVPAVDYRYPFLDAE